MILATCPVSIATGSVYVINYDCNTFEMKFGSHWGAIMWILFSVFLFASNKSHFRICQPHKLSFWKKKLSLTRSRTRAHIHILYKKILIGSKWTFRTWLPRNGTNETKNMPFHKLLHYWRSIKHAHLRRAKHRKRKTGYVCVCITYNVTIENSHRQMFMPIKTWTSLSRSLSLSLTVRVCVWMYDEIKSMTSLVN